MRGEIPVYTHLVVRITCIRAALSGRAGRENLEILPIYSRRVIVASHTHLISGDLIAPGVIGMLDNVNHDTTAFVIEEICRDDYFLRAQKKLRFSRRRAPARAILPRRPNDNTICY